MLQSCYRVEILLRDVVFACVQEFYSGGIFSGQYIFANPMAHFAVNPRQRVGVVNCFDWYVIFYGG